MPEGTGGIVYGDQHAFMIRAPSGWVLDTESGVPDDLHAVLYPTGSSWEHGTAVMYANTCLKARDECRTLEELVAFDEARFRARSPAIVVEGAASMPTGDHKQAVVRSFRGDPYGSHEAVAYIDERTVIVLLVLSARTPDAFEESRRAFESLVGSYVWITDDVTPGSPPRVPRQESPPNPST